MTHQVLILYYSFTNQTRRVGEGMAAAFRERGCDVALCEIELVDERYPMNLPLRPFWRRMLKMIPVQLLGKTGQVRVDEQALAQNYDLICIGSPTWWFYPALPVGSMLKSESAPPLFDARRFAVFTVCRAFWGANLRSVKRLATKAGGRFVDSAAFVFQGNQVRSMLSFINYLQNGENRDRFWGYRIYPFGVPDEGIERAKSFANRLADGLNSEHGSEL